MRTIKVFGEATRARRITQCPGSPCDEPCRQGRICPARLHASAVFWRLYAAILLVAVLGAVVAFWPEAGK